MCRKAGNQRLLAIPLKQEERNESGGKVENEEARKSVPEMTVRPQPEKVFKVWSKAPKDHCRHDQTRTAKGERSGRMGEGKGH